ncbi:SET domain-containing protein 4 [Bombyx mandarina]|uniref:SET domain-containing protein 4 n=1 Tax=Bombyx mandarina TaxID=7092 RepID=A0A6J2KAN2_BOMMA|nr:SET domain-containing protein 4 [Bombyx mandarina]
MGRTKRKRRQKISRSFCTCGANEELILLNTWLKKNGVRRKKELALAVFSDTGRGVLTKKRIRPGDELISLPLNLTINVSTILMDRAFCSIFLENKIPCLSTYKKTVSFQSLLAFYLTYLKAQGIKTKWHIYLKNLPQEYTVPYFLPNEIKCNVDPEILDVISNQKCVIETTYNIFFQLLKTCKNSCDSVSMVQKHFCMSLYEWAYFTVNTRCVYIDLSKIIDLKNVENNLLNIISDNTNISLCPYLDMINHSPCARNETKLLVNKDIENVKVKDLKDELFLDVTFSIYTKNFFDAHSQVFICYGDSHNLKLITEYGFCIPKNDLDYVSFPFDIVLQYFNTRSIKVSLEQINFIHSHGLNKDLHIDSKGLSYNFYGLLMVIKYYHEKNKDISRLIYSAAICSNDSKLNELVKPMAVDKCNLISNSVNELKKSGCEAVELMNCIELMCQYIGILEKFIKS